MQTLRQKKGFLCDMDGVIYHGDRLLPGVREFVHWLQDEKKEFLFLTNNSGKTQRELQAKLSRMGLDIDEHHFYTSALATAEFLASQMPGARAFVIGEPGLLNALYERGITIDEALILLAQLSGRKDRLNSLASRQPQERLGNRYFGSSNGPIEYRYANYDVAQAEADYRAVADEIAALQLELDLVNQTEVFSVEL